MKKHFLFLSYICIFFSTLYSQERTIIERAKNEFRKGNYQQVIKILESEKIKENQEILYYLGISYYNLKNYEKAKYYIENLIFKTEIEDPSVLNQVLKTIFEIYRKDRKFDDIINTGEYILKKIEDKPKFSFLLSIVKNNLSFAYRENGNIYLRNSDFQKAIDSFLVSLNYNPQNFLVKSGLGEAYYNIGNYEKAKQIFIDVIKNEKNNHSLLTSSINYYRMVSDDKEKENLKPLLQENSLSYRIFLSFEMFSSGNYEEGMKILKEEEDKRNTNGEISFNVINRIFPYDFSSLKVYLNFIKFYPESSRNVNIIINLFKAISEEDKKSFENEIEKVLDEIAKDEKKKDQIVNLYMNIIEGKFERRLTSIDDYIEKIKEYEKLLEKYKENKYKEEILKRIADLYFKIDDYDKTKEIYKKMIEEFKKEEYNLKIAESYFKEGDFQKAEEIVNSFFIKNKDNEKAKLLISKIYIEKGELEKGMEVIYDIVKNSRDRNIQREVESIKSNIFEAKEILENGLFIIFRKIENNSTRLVIPDEILFLNQISKEIEFYPFSDEKRETEFKLKYSINEKNSTSQPYVMINEENGKYYYLWEDKIFIDKSKYRKKNIYKIFYPVKEIVSDDFKIDGKIEVLNNNYVLNLNFDFSESDWELSIRNYRNYGEIVKIEPSPEIQERNLIVWNVKSKNLNIKITYQENKNVIYYFPEIEIKKKVFKEKNIQPENGKVFVDNFELKIENFIPSSVKLLEENLKVYNFKEFLQRK